MANKKFEYEAVVLRWVDGDTVVLQIILEDKGFGMLEVYQPRKPHYRLMGVNTPEKRPHKSKHTDADGNFDEESFENEKKRALDAQKFCEEYAPVGSKVYVRTYLDEEGKFGRPLVDLYADNDYDGGAGTNSLNKRLLDAKHAVKYDT